MGDGGTVEVWGRSQTIRHIQAHGGRHFPRPRVACGILHLGDIKLGLLRLRSSFFGLPLLP